MYGCALLYSAVRAGYERAVTTPLRKDSQHGNEEPRWRNGTSLCCAQGKAQYHELAPHNKADDFARDREGHLVHSRTEGFETCGFLWSHVIDFWQEDNSQENNVKQTPLHLAAKRMNIRMVIEM